MFSPVLAATQFSLDYFELRKGPLDDALAEDVIFSVDAEICEPGTDPQHFEAKFEGRDSVISSLTARHFAITTKIDLKNLNCTKLDKDRVKVKFISIETKKEAEDKDPITYKYTGHYNLGFARGEEGLLVKEIALTNRRENLQS